MTLHPHHRAKKRKEKSHSNLSPTPQKKSHADDIPPGLRTPPPTHARTQVGRCTRKRDSSSPKTSRSVPGSPVRRGRQGGGRRTNRSTILSRDLGRGSLQPWGRGEGGGGRGGTVAAGIYGLINMASPVHHVTRPSGICDFFFFFTSLPGHGINFAYLFFFEISN